MPSRSALAALVVLLAAPASAADRPQSGTRTPSGLSVSVDIGGGGDLGGPTGVFEAELAAGYGLGRSLALELALLLGTAPGNYFGLRPGVHVAIPDTPYYARAAIDIAGPNGSLEWRWLLLGVGAELRFTDVVGAFAEADTGLPLSHGFGVPVLARAGVFFSF